MSLSRTLLSRYGMGILLTAGTIVLATSGARAADDVEKGPFAGLSGTWAGAGTVTMANGTQEHIRCRANYSVPPLGTSLNQGLQCASDSYRFDVKANVFLDEGGALKGTWSEATNQVAGNVTGHIEPGHIETAVSSPAFSAHLSVKTQGGKQSVLIQPQGTDVRNVSIEMRRS